MQLIISSLWKAKKLKIWSGNFQKWKIYLLSNCVSWEPFHISKPLFKLWSVVKFRRYLSLLPKVHACGDFFVFLLKCIQVFAMAMKTRLLSITQSSGMASPIGDLHHIMYKTHALYQQQLLYIIQCVTELETICINRMCILFFFF